MVQKRPFGDEESYEVSCKHPRQVDYSNKLVSFLEFARAEDKAWQPNISVIGEVVEGSFRGGDEKHTGDIITEFPFYTGNNSKTTVPHCISNMSWSSSTSEEDDDRSEAPFHLLFSPEYYNADRPIRALVHSEETRTSSPFEFPPQKLVPIGADFQADVPEWGAQGAKNGSDSSDGSEPFSLFPQALESDINYHNDPENKLAGICVIQMPEFGPSAYADDKVGGGRTDCCCEDSGSVRCVRQHIEESRERLWRTLGHERFLELGFSDMGEVVADKWSQEEELLFREVVFSNPMSLGKNFWDHLSMVFPSRDKKNSVSYYYNVFMLQRRAVQNRYYPMNIDSDDDEWQESDDDGDDEGGAGEEDEDSVVESPACHDEAAHDEILECVSHEYNESVPYAGYNDYENIVVGSSQDEKGDHGVQDNSCMSDDAETHVKDNNSKCLLGSFDSVSGGGGHEYVLEHCDTKVWDVGYSTCPRNEVEFLPTCSMIEEVFGVGAWDYMAGDGKGLS